MTDLIAAAVADAHARWPGLPALGDRFDVAIAARTDGETDSAAAIAQLALADLYLVTACLEQHRAALAAFEKLVRDETTRAVAKLGAHAPPAEDVIQELLLKLLVTDGDRPAKLAAYGGHGALHAWLRVAAVRTAISMNRRKQELSVEDDALAAIADESDDQALAFLKSSYRAEFKAAFAAAFAELPRRARTLLRLQVNDQLTIEEIGAFYAVSRATAARHLAEARSQLVGGTHQRLAATLGISAVELGELMRLVASTLYSTLPRLLRTTTTKE
ncbi:MAG: sigma-70 family RNA polymerase sigma factor [Deltaproteobacteria bacterium]